MRKICSKLKELRSERGISILALGKQIGVSDATICRWENGKSDVPSDAIILLAEFFGVTADYLLGLEK